VMEETTDRKGPGCVRQLAAVCLWFFVRLDAAVVGASAKVALLYVDPMRWVESVVHAILDVSDSFTGGLRVGPE
jgi:hypothetical protein